VDEPSVNPKSAEDRRRSLWRNAWGVVLAASTAFSAGYGASRNADPSAGASRPPAWPLLISLLVVAVSLYLVLAPTLHRWPFEEREHEPTGTEDGEPWLVELTDADEQDHSAR
jgi:hypothetical protein